MNQLKCSCRANGNASGVGTVFGRLGTCRARQAHMMQKNLAGRAKTAQHSCENAPRPQARPMPMPTDHTGTRNATALAKNPSDSLPVRI